MKEEKDDDKYVDNDFDSISFDEDDKVKDDYEAPPATSGIRG
jgi:hypothetical protein